MKLKVKGWVIKTIICLILIIINCIIYCQTINFSYVCIEEMEAASVFHEGFNADSMKTLISSPSYFRQLWQPVAVLTCMFSSEMFGDNPGPKHLINIALHVCSTVLLFLCFSSMTGTIWPCALLAGLFAAHPVNVESVAWLAHHDSALNLFFISLSLYFYIRYIQRSSTSIYILVVLFYLLSLLSSPRIMAFPLLLILLDVWPLERLRSKASKYRKREICPLLTGLRIREKAPMLGIGLLYGLSMLAIKSNILEGASANVNFGDTLVSYVAYLQRLLLLPNIECNYYLTRPFYSSTAQILTAAAMLITISSVVLCLSRTNRLYLAVGWFWFLLSVTPGVLVNASLHNLITDHYVYLGAIGIYVIIAFGWQELFSRSRSGTIAATIIGIFLIVTLTVIARQRTVSWRNTLTLLEHTIAIAPERVSQQRVGDVLLALERPYEAIKYYELSLQEMPTNHLLHTNIGIALMKTGQLQKAIDHLKMSIALYPKNAVAYHNLGNAYIENREIDKAIANFKKSLEINPTAYQTYNSLATALVEGGQIEKAIACLEEALKINPRYETAMQNLRQLRTP